MSNRGPNCLFDKSKVKNILPYLASLVCLFSASGKMLTEYPAEVPTPTLSEISYGPHERNVLDVWLAKSDQPTPLVFHIHGGSWKTGSKETVSINVKVQELLDAGISVVSINYRLIKEGGEIRPAVKEPLFDAARALQFVRTKAGEWNVDSDRIGLAGRSAGACSSLWIALHRDLADPAASDPVLRESTRVACLAIVNAQTSIDPKQMKEWLPNSKYGSHAFGLPGKRQGFELFLEQRDELLPWIRLYSPYGLLTKHAPPMALFYKRAPNLGDDKDPTHSAVFGVKLQERCRELGVKCDLIYPGAKGTQYANQTEYFITNL